MMVPFRALCKIRSLMCSIPQETSGLLLLLFLSLFPRLFTFLIDSLRLSFKALKSSLVVARVLPGTSFENDATLV